METNQIASPVPANVPGYQDFIEKQDNDERPRWFGRVIISFLDVSERNQSCIICLKMLLHDGGGGHGGDPDGQIQASEKLFKHWRRIYVGFALLE